MSWPGISRDGVGAGLAPVRVLYVMEEEEPELPEWLRVIWIFIATFALMAVLSGVAGVKIDWVEDPSMPPDIYNRPY